VLVTAVVNRLPAKSATALAATETTMLPVVGLLSGVTTKVYVLSLILVKTPAVPPVTLILPALNAATDSLKLKVKVTGPLAVPGVLSLMVSVGAVVSTTGVVTLLTTA